jgi:hypothetical protein
MLGIKALAAGEEPSLLLCALANMPEKVFSFKYNILNLFLRQCVGMYV